MYIPGIERITYADRLHFVPGLAKPKFPRWVRDYEDRTQYNPPPPLEERELYKETPCFVFHQRTKLLEGVRQALWLSKSKMIQGLPAQVLALGEANQIENEDERVKNAIKHACLWDTTEPLSPKFVPTLLRNLLHLCGSLTGTHPGLRKRILAEKYSPIAIWHRDEDLFQVRGQNGLLLNSMSPLPVLAGKEDVQATADHVLPTFYPVSPTIDLWNVQLYEDTERTGFHETYPYPHAHTLFFVEDKESHVKMLPEQLRAKMVMFAFANALVRAHAINGPESGELEQPIVVQAVGTNGRLFQYVVFQLNTTSLRSDSGVKNLVWVDEDQLLYEHAMDKDILERKVVKVPKGLSGYQPETFKKFLSLYLHGAA